MVRPDAVRTAPRTVDGQGQSRACPRPEVLVCQPRPPFQKKPPRGNTGRCDLTVMVPPPCNASSDFVGGGDVHSHASWLAQYRIGFAKGPGNQQTVDPI